MISSGNDKWNKEKVEKDKTRRTNQFSATYVCITKQIGLFELASSQGQMETETR